MIEDKFHNYNLVGNYDQDKLNGFNDNVFDNLFKNLDLHNGQIILDLMCGNGNLSRKLINYNPNLMIYGIDISEIQIKFGSEQNISDNIFLISGDARKLPFSNLYFDRAVRKSASHEIKPCLQKEILKEVYRTLKNNTYFIDLSMIFENELLREEFSLMTNLKDKLSGLDDLVNNRYFYMKHELFDLFYEAGFDSVLESFSFNYNISLDYAFNVYFNNNQDKINQYIDYLNTNCKNLLSLGVITLVDQHYYLRPPAKIITAIKNE